MWGSFVQHIKNVSYTLLSLCPRGFSARVFNMWVMTHVCKCVSVCLKLMQSKSSTYMSVLNKVSPRTKCKNVFFFFVF